MAPVPPPTRVGRALALSLLVALATFAAGCASLPSLEGRAPTSALTDTAATRLGRAATALTSTHPGKSGIHAVPVPTDAFAARVLLAAAAEKSLDVQYYIWHADQTGNLLFEAVWRAAERGVRVRLLLDDANTKGEDATIAALDAHPNIEVRLYNPLMQRDARLLNFLADFTRVNRRMHNKSFTADNQVTIIGGRNVGNEYFGAGDEVVFTDLDVMAVGPVVNEVSKEFDLYWNSASAYPADRILPKSGAESAVVLEAAFAATRADLEATRYIDALGRTRLVNDLVERNLALEWADARVVADDPAKTLEPTVTKDVLLLTEVLSLMGPPNTSFDLVSPYFVPGDEGTAALERLAQRGVEVRVLTNSLAATDVAPVHAGYAKRRCDLLRAGVRLYELRPSASPYEKETKSVGSGSTVQLHAKTSAVDGDRIFVGSFNFDQRSALLNTEMGMVIESPALARRLASALDAEAPAQAYELRIAADGHCPEWIERTPAGEVHYDAEPGTSAAKRAWIEFLELLPIEWLL